MGVSEQFKEGAFRLVVLCGGSGREREVSIASGRAVYDALKGQGWSVALETIEADVLPADLDSSRDIVLPLIHGTYGEDGRLSQALEDGGFAYGGSDARSSALAFDKVASKARAMELGLPVARHCLIRAGEAIDIAELSSELGMPFVLKPSREGSSVGLIVIRGEETGAETISEVAEQDLLAETYHCGVDVTVAILGDSVLGSVSIHPDGGVYDYAHKYTAGLTRYACPAEIEPGVREALESAALAVYRECGCRDLARVDFRVDREGRFIFLEINTLPGMTATSLFPMAAMQAGVSFEELLARWAGFALARHAGDQR